MKTKSKRFQPNGSYYFDSVIPVECPHCGAYSTPHVINHTSLSNSGYNIRLYVFFNDCCDQYSYAIYKEKDRVAEFLGILPVFHKTATLPDSVHAISPRFVKLYNQCYDAEQNGALELAGSGYRNAMEVLIKDFAINELGIPREEVVKYKLEKAIEKYLPNIQLAKSADVVRVLGNDHTHFERHYEDIDFEVLKRYLQIFINSVDCEYLIRHPVVRTNPKLSDK